MLIDKNALDNMEARFRAGFLNRLNGYKSPVLVGTKNDDSVKNLTLISSLFHLGANPALLGIIFRPNTVKRHGLENILKQKCYTINFIKQDMIQNAHQSSARYDESRSEFQEVDLKSSTINNFPAPFVAASKLKLAMNFKQKIDIELNGTHLIIGEIDFIQSDEDFDDLSLVSDIAVNGLDTYYQVKKLTKLSYAKPEIKLKEL